MDGRGSSRNYKRIADGNANLSVRDLADPVNHAHALVSSRNYATANSVGLPECSGLAARR